MAKYYNDKGELVELPITVQMYREAAEAGMSFSQYLNHKFPTNVAKHGATFNQALASEGIYLKANREFGIRPSTLDQIVNPRIEGSALVRDANPTSRIIFPAAILQAVEDKLVANMTMAANAFNQLVAVDDAISNDHFIRPVLNFSKPEAARSQVISQLAQPNSMLSITVSETSRKIPTYSLGMEVADQALKNVTLDLVSLALARQAAVETNERANDNILALLNGDTDMEQDALSQTKANSLDATITTAGKLTQEAWMLWLFNNATKRTITHVVTDIKGALAIQNREGRPVVTGDNATSPRIDTIERVMNPLWPDNVQVYITTDPNWPANTIMGLDKAYAIHRVTSVTASYQAVEQYVLRRSSAMRFDHGVISYRLFDEAYDVLSLTL